MRSLYSQLLLEDVIDSEEQNFLILTEHKRAHRNHEENKLQLLKKIFFPKMRATVKNIVEKCRTCQLAKYTRHPDKPLFQQVPIPKYPMQILQIDLFTIEKQWFITTVDCFTKFAFIEKIKSKSRIDLEKPLLKILTQITTPEMVVMDNEPSLKTEVIRNKINELNITVYETPTGRSEVNGQIERVHSTITEIYRCLKTDDIGNSPAVRMKMSVDRYNNTIYSVINMSPREALFGKKTTDKDQHH